MEDNIKMNLKEISCDDVDWIYLPQERNQWQALLYVVRLVTYIITLLCVCVCYV
jgi:hypothetical protein